MAGNMTQHTSAIAADLHLSQDPYADPGEQARSLASLRVHYDVERELASQLRSATQQERKGLYASAYDELYRRVPDHPQLVNKQDPADRRRYVDDQMRLLGRFLKPGMSMIEIGPGDCSLAIHACQQVGTVWAVDVSAEITRRTDLPRNFELHLSDGVSVPHPVGGVDVVYSNQLMEHLHPEDAHEQLRNILAALAAGGVYVCVTPNRLMGPHDISKYFSHQAQGFHLQEYTATELLALFRAIGFRRTDVYVAVKNRYVRMPNLLVRGCEYLLSRCSVGQRRKLSRYPPFRWLATICAVGRQ